MIGHRYKLTKLHKWCKRCLILAAFCVMLCLSAAVNAQSNNDFEEIYLMVNMQRVGNTELSALIKGEAAYLPIKELFDFLKIRNIPSASFDTISGFYIQPQSAFLINKLQNTITYRNKLFALTDNDLVLTETNLYLRSDLFNNIFELDCSFNFRSLSVALSSKVEVPVIREMRQDAMRKNIIKLKGEKKADTTICRTYPLFRVGMFDWSVIATRDVTGNNSTRAVLAFGANIAGGETDVYLNLADKAMNRANQFYRWRYVNNDNNVIKQVVAGRVNAQSIASIFAPVVGFQINNTPTTYRRSFGTYMLSNTTEPGWLVELYVNNILINYMQADASGFFSFEVPMVYGNSTVKLKFFGPWGEERTREQTITVPFNFLPKNQLEYNITAGFVQDADHGRFTRAVVNYGLSNKITFGGGLEYLSTLPLNNTLKFVNASVRLTSNLLMSAEYTAGVRSKALLSYRLPSNFQFELEFTRYAKGQQAIKFNYLAEKRAVFSMPFRSKNFSSFSRLTLSQATLPKSRFTTAEYLVSSIIKGISTNVTTNAYFTDPKNPFVFSSLSATVRVKKAYRLTPLMQYNYKGNRVSTLKIELEKNIAGNGFVNAAYEQNLISHLAYTSLGIRYNFSFAQTAITARRGNNRTSLVQSARGSVMFNDQTGRFAVNNQNNVGKGGLTIVPFLDVNCNGIRDADEYKVVGLTANVNGGRQIHNKDTTISILSLEAYTHYIVELNKDAFENVAWQLKKKSLSVAIDPNMFKLVEVPIMVVGEVSGTVYLSGSKGKNGLSRVIVNIFDARGKLAGRTLTEADGYYSYLGLPPGKYNVVIDAEQLNKLKLSTLSANSAFTIKPSREGDMVEGKDFVLKEHTPGSLSRL